MELDNIKLQTTWNDAAGSINTNFLKLLQAITALQAEGGGLDESQLEEYLTANGYTKQDWVLAQQYITQAALDGLASEDWVRLQGYLKNSDLASINAAILALNNYFVGGVAKNADNLDGKDSTYFASADALNALMSRQIIAGTGLSGGGSLSANRTIALQFLGGSGTYYKVTVDDYGRVTLGSEALDVNDLPDVPTSKIIGLEDVLKSLEITVDSEVSDTSENPIQNKAIKQYADLHSRYEIIEEIDVPNGIIDYATETWVKDQGYATETWVEDKGYATEKSIEDAGFAKETWVEEKGYATEAWVEEKDYATNSSVAEAGFATEKWVEDKGYATIASITEAGFATEKWVEDKNYATVESVADAGFATEQWVEEKGYITEAALDGLASETYVNDKTSDAYNNALNDAKAWVEDQEFATEESVTQQGFLKDSDLSAIRSAISVLQSYFSGGIANNADKLDGKDSTFFATAEALNALLSRQITAGEGLSGGGNLSANRTLSLQYLGGAGTYYKVTVDNYGRVTLGETALTEADIPNISPSKIIGLDDIINNIEIDVDDEMSDTSENPVQNKVIKEYADLHSRYEVINEIDVPDGIVDYATETWVKEQGYVTEDSFKTINGQPIIGEGNIVIEGGGNVDLTGYATEEWVKSQSYAKTSDIPSLNGYATQQWVTSQGFAKSSDIPSLNGYATQTWVNNKGYATESWVTNKGYATQQWVTSQNYMPKTSFKTINGQTITGTGNIVIEGGGDVDMSDYLSLSKGGTVEAVTTFNDSVIFNAGASVNGYFLIERLQSLISIILSSGASLGWQGDTITSWNDLRVKETTVSSGTTSLQMSPNVLYKLPSGTNMTLSFASGISGVANYYMFEVAVGSTIPTITLPSSVKWMDGYDVLANLEADKTYQVSIVNNLAVGGAF